MLKSRMILCAESVIRDTDANSVSIINLAEGLVVQSFPSFIPRLSVLGLFTRDEGDPARIKVRLEGVIGTTVLFNAEGELNFEDKLRTRFIVNLIGLAITGPGKLRVSFYEDKRKLGAYEIEIVFNTAALEIRPLLQATPAAGKKSGAAKKSKKSAKP